MGSGSKSILQKQNPKSVSLRATVPIGVVEQLDLREGDTLDWEITFIEGKKAVMVRKV